MRSAHEAAVRAAASSKITTKNKHETTKSAMGRPWLEEGWILVASSTTRRPKGVGIDSWREKTSPGPISARGAFEQGFSCRATKVGPNTAVWLFSVTLMTTRTV